MRLSSRMLASVVVVNLIAAPAFASAAQADPSPENPSGPRKVTTESGKTGCLVDTGRVLCTGQFANAPVHHGHSDNTVWIQADGGGLQWNDSNLPSTGSYDAKYDVVLTYGQVFHLHGWTVEPSSAGTRFINDDTGHGLFVSIGGVTGF